MAAFTLRRKKIIIMNGPSRTFALVGMVAGILLLLHQLPSLSVAGIDLRDINILSDIMPPRVEQDLNLIPRPKDPLSAMVPKNDVNGTPLKYVAPKGVTLIEDYSDTETDGMNNFYKKLKNVQALNRPVRIAYYGDSFIEGDILTCDLRELLQRRFGGSGVGWIDCSSLVAGLRPSVVLQSAGFQIFEAVTKPFDTHLQGINQRYFIAGEGAQMIVKGTKYKPQLYSWRRSSLFFRTQGGVTISTFVNGKATTAHSFSGGPSLQMAETKAATHSIAYTLTGVGHGTLFYGAALESEKGIVLDNLSMRGATGTTIAAIPQATLKEFARLRPYDLIVVQFGLNVANSKDPAAYYRQYVKRMKHSIAALRQAFPESVLLVVSVPDRDQKTVAGITTMKGIEELCAFQRLMASDMKVAFYDFFTAMGGKGSMQRLVNRRMANKDYTHLSFGGGRLLARKFFASLMAGYDYYLKKEDVNNLSETKNE